MSCVLRVLDRFEQFLEGAPEAVKADDAEAVTGASMVDEFAQPRALELLSGDHVDEDANSASLPQPVFLSGDVPGPRSTREHSRGCLLCGWFSAVFLTLDSETLLRGG